MSDIYPVEPYLTENSEVWPTSFTDLIPLEEDVITAKDIISAEERSPSYRLTFSDIPDPYPAIPNFGILYLSIHRAVSLIVRDLFILTPHRYPSIQGNSPDPEHAARLDKVDAEMKVAVEGHLFQAIDNGRLAAVKTRGDIEDFLAHGDGLESKRTFIPFKDLVNWLAKNGYGQILESPMTAFGEYMDSELALAREVEEFVLRRRRLQEFNDSELASITDPWSMWGLELDHTSEVDKRLAYATEEIQSLKSRINRMLDSPVERHLHKKEQDSILIVLAALLELKGHRELKKDWVSKVKERAEHIDGGRSVNCVSKWLGEAIDLIPRSKKDF